MHFRILLALTFYTSLGFAQISLPVDFELSNTSYFLDFGGNASTVVTDPTDPNNVVAKSTKETTAETWAGTIIGETGFSSPIPFSAGNTRMSMRVYSEYPGAAIHVKLEHATDASLSVETRMYTTKSNEWETIVFDFLNQIHNSPVLDLNIDYSKFVVFFDFGTSGAAGMKDFYWDDVAMGGISTTLAQIDLPATFELPGVSYALVDFENNSSTLGADPLDASQTVAITTKSVSTSAWSGTIVGTRNGFANTIPFSPTATKVRMRVYSPEINIPVLLKTEVANNPDQYVQTLQYTSTANEWEVMEWDFLQHQPNTPSLDFNLDYNLLAVFFNFGVEGATSGEQIYYWDDVTFDINTNTAERNNIPATAFPNPVTNELHIRLNGEILALQVFNTLGQLVFSEQGSGYNNTFDLSSLSPGAYFVQFKTREGKGHFLITKG